LIEIQNFAVFNYLSNPGIKLVNLVKKEGEEKVTKEEIF